ncbi:unnamed protein product, partial [Phaeothamnion confervicola]
MLAALRQGEPLPSLVAAFVREQGGLLRQQAAVQRAHCAWLTAERCTHAASATTTSAPTLGAGASTVAAAGALGSALNSRQRMSSSLPLSASGVGTGAVASTGPRKKHLSRTVTLGASTSAEGTMPAPPATPEALVEAALRGVWIESARACEAVCAPFQPLLRLVTALLQPPRPHHQTAAAAVGAGAA